MTDPTPETHQELHEVHEEHEPEVAEMPRWIPLLIGLILAIMAGLAVYTGLRYRDDEAFTTPVASQGTERRAASAPPGEPEPGASLVTQDTPAAKPPVEGDARAVISGGPAGVAATVRIWARRGMLLEVTPAESLVYVNDMPIGQASQFDTIDEVYEFAAPGSYNIRIVAPSNQQKTYVVTAAEDARQDIARIRAAL
jgi:hypothetical protein